MTEKNISIIAIIIGIAILAFLVKWNTKLLTQQQKNQRATTIVMGFLWLLGGIFLLSFSLKTTSK